jgi:phage terminase large subunit-like protein
VGDIESAYFVIDDASLHASPRKWATRVATVYGKHKADRVVVEANQGGAMVADTLRAIAANLPVRSVHARRSKQLRAEPVVALYEQGRVHHVGVHALLEEQATT